MKKFHYICEFNNETQEGFISALNMQEAVKKLERKRYKIIQLKEFFDEINTNVNVDPFTITEKKEFFNSLYYQYKAGLPIIETFETIANTSKNKNIQILGISIAKKLKAGVPFEKIMNGFSELIGKENASLLIAGEKAGKLYETSFAILKNVEKEEKIKKELISKSIYPCLTLGLALFAGMLLFMFILPQLQSSFEEFCLYSFLVQLGKTILKISIIMGLIVFGGRILIKNPKFTNFIQNKVLSLRIFSKVFEIYCYMMFFRVLAIAYSAGCTLIDSIKLGSILIKQADIQRKIIDISNRLNNGMEVTTAFEMQELFENHVISQISTASKSAEYDSAFREIANDFESDLNIQITAFLNLFNLLTLIFCGIIVAVLLAVFYLNYYDALLRNF